jgi:hypothetical protein
MNKRYIDLTGQKFNRLTPIKYMNGSKWLCKCICGKEIVVISSNLINGNTKSCGCLKFKHGHSRRKKFSKTYITWVGIINRCTNPNHARYKDYGGRGIKICDRWMKFENFLADVGEIPKNKEIDRINNNGGYSPDNFRLVDRQINARNRRNNIYITFNNETHLLLEWAKITDINYNTLYLRIYAYNWSIEKSFTTPSRKYKICV